MEGRLKYGKFTNKDGHEQNTVDIIATEMQLLGGREGMGGQDEDGGGAPRREVLAIRPFWHLRLQSRSRTIICRPPISFSRLGAL